MVALRHHVTGAGAGASGSLSGAGGSGGFLPGADRRSRPTAAAV